MILLINELTLYIMYMVHIQCGVTDSRLAYLWCWAYYLGYMQSLVVIETIVGRSPENRDRGTVHNATSDSLHMLTLISTHACVHIYVHVHVHVFVQCMYVSGQCM